MNIKNAAWRAKATILIGLAISLAVYAIELDMSGSSLEDVVLLKTAITPQSPTEIFSEVEVKAIEPEYKEATSTGEACLSLLIFGESRGETLTEKADIAWAVLNRVNDPRDNNVYRSSVCEVISVPKQYSSMGIYIKDIDGITAGNVKFTPWLAKQSSADMQAWTDSKAVAKAIMDGSIPQATEANHFISFANMATNKFPAWVAALRPVGVSGLHILYSDYVMCHGKRIILTGERTYKQVKRMCTASRYAKH